MILLYNFPPRHNNELKFYCFFFLHPLITMESQLYSLTYFITMESRFHHYFLWHPSYPKEIMILSLITKKSRFCYDKKTLTMEFQLCCIVF